MDANNCNSRSIFFSFKLFQLLKKECQKKGGRGTRERERESNKIERHLLRKLLFFRINANLANGISFTIFCTPNLPEEKSIFGPLKPYSILNIFTLKL
jgi:hypothetical protein